MVGPKYQRPTASVPAEYKEPPPDNFKEVGQWKQAEPNDGMIRGKWWEIFNDPELNELEEQVNLSNQNILAAEAQFRGAREAVRITRSGLFPTVGVNPSIISSRTSTPVTNNPVSGVRTAYILPFEISYVADHLGKHSTKRYSKRRVCSGVGCPVGECPSGIPC